MAESKKYRASANVVLAKTGKYYKKGQVIGETEYNKLPGFAKKRFAQLEIIAEVKLAETGGETGKEK